MKNWGRKPGWVHTASDKNLGVGKAGYKANVHYTDTASDKNTFHNIDVYLLKYLHNMTVIFHYTTNIMTLYYLG